MIISFFMLVISSHKVNMNFSRRNTKIILEKLILAKSVLGYSIFGVLRNRRWILFDELAFRYQLVDPYKCDRLYLSWTLWDVLLQHVDERKISSKVNR